MKRIKLLLSAFLWIILSALGQAQTAPYTTAPNIVACPNTIVHIPVTVTNFNHIGAISLTLDYDKNVLVFMGFTHHVNLPASFTVDTLFDGRIRVGGYETINPSGTTIADGEVLFTIDFYYNGGNTNLTWFDSGISCEYSTNTPNFLPLIDNPQSTYYINGSVSPYPSAFISSVSGTSPLNINETTLYSASGVILGGGTGTWSCSDTLVAKVNPLTGLVTAKSPGTCYIIYTVNGCNSTYTKQALLVVNGFPIDIVLQKGVNCGEFDVILKPTIDISGNLNKIVFTVKWPATAGTDVQFTGFTSLWPNLQQIGSIESYGGYYYCLFSSLTDYLVNWAANSSDTIMTFYHSGTGEGNADFKIISSSYLLGNNTAYSIEFNNSDATGSIINNADNLSLNCGLFLKDILQGAYDNSLVPPQIMRTDLLDAGYLPLSQPYENTPLAYSGTESVNSFTASVVDWVVVELRTDVDPSTMVSQQAALLLSDGNIVSSDQINAPIFHSVTAGNSYYVVIYHRNHLPVMTANAIIFPNTPLTRYDFTTIPEDNVYGGLNGVAPVDDFVFGQIAGDINMDNRLKFSGSGNDRALVFVAILNVLPDAITISTIHGYYTEDINLNGEVKYSGAGNDQGLIWANIDYFANPAIVPISVYYGVVPVNY